MFFALETSSKPTLVKKVYLQTTYPATHQALHIPSPKDEGFIAILNIFDVKMAVKLNSTDARGYRSVVALVTDDMASTLNRPYLDEEKLALSIALSLMSSLYEKFSMAVNTEIAGNNSQSVEAGIIQMGTIQEPSVLHGHVIGRGNPTTCYIADIPLRGPIAGELFNMRGDGTEPGNDKKIPWLSEERKCIASTFAEQLPQKIRSSPIFSQIISIVSLRPTPDLEQDSLSPSS